MSRTTTDDCVENCPNHFSLAYHTALRAQQILRRGDARVAEGDDRYVVIALREIAKGLYPIEPMLLEGGAAPVKISTTAASPIDFLQDEMQAAVAAASDSALEREETAAKEKEAPEKETAEPVTAAPEETASISPKEDMQTAAAIVGSAPEEDSAPKEDSASKEDSTPEEETPAPVAAETSDSTPETETPAPINTAPAEVEDTPTPEEVSPVTAESTTAAAPIDIPPDDSPTRDA